MTRGLCEECVSEKEFYRQRYQALRDQISLEERQESADALFQHVLEIDALLDKYALYLNVFQKEAVGRLDLGFYAPIKSELDPTKLIRFLKNKHRIALPVVTEQGLIFRLWSVKAPLKTGVFNIKEPPVDATVVTPHVLFVPLLAFDKDGNRIGYGKGFYDRYFHKHHKRLSGSLYEPLAIGVAYDSQLCDKLPRDSQDWPLDYVVTNKALYMTSVLGRYLGALFGDGP